MKEITVHVDDILCACPNCRKSKGEIVVIAEPPENKPVFFANPKVPTQDEIFFKEIRYKLNKYANEDGYWFKYDKM